MLLPSYSSFSFISFSGSLNGSISAYLFMSLLKLWEVQLYYLTISNVTSAVTVCGPSKVLVRGTIYVQRPSSGCDIFEPWNCEWRLMFWLSSFTSGTSTVMDSAEVRIFLIVLDWFVNCEYFFVSKTFFSSLSNFYVCKWSSGDSSSTNTSYTVWWVCW